MSGWLRRQRGWLIALAALVPAVVLAALWPSWFDYQLSRTGLPFSVEAGGSAQYAGATWRIDQWRVLDARDAAQQGSDLPEGAELVAVLIEVAPGAEAPQLCNVELVDVAGDRRWGPGYDRVDLPGGADAESVCVEGASEPYLLRYTWVVPAGVADSAVIEVTVFAASPVRMRLEP